GAVDKQTQRAAWTVGDNKTTVYDAGISNLSNDEAPVLIHIGKDKTQQWMLVRLKQTDQQSTGN
ncbi:MAG TPA: protocadherin, partial [Pirellulales bacterium]|nr:protocadherin [Pirellulales bacterium]